MSDLLPCPFCGSDAVIERGSDHHGIWFNIGCSRHWGAVSDPDNACLGGRLFYTEAEINERDAIAAWNRRADLPRPQDAARIAELEKALIEVTHPDFIWGALDNVYDAETTLDEYAAAVSRAQRAALAADSGAAE